VRLSFDAGKFPLPVQWSAAMESNSNLESVSFDRDAIASFSYDECIERLADAVDHHNDAELEEVACLISQLAVVIE
jgi:hypothetical protein